MNDLTNDLVRLGRSIRDARKAHGMSQQSLADALGVHRPAVSNWERGVHAPTSTNLEEIARVLSTDVDSLRRGGLLFEVVSRTDASSPRANRVAESADRYVARPTPRVPPRAYQLIFEYCATLEQAEVPEDLVDEARRLMSGETFNTLRKHTAQERSEEGWIKDVNAAWAFISDTLREKGFDL